jgi:hypothetical protein
LPNLPISGSHHELGGGPSPCSKQRRIQKRLPQILEEQLVSRQQKKFQEQWTESEAAIAFLKPLRELCKSEDAEEIDSLLSTCFEKLSELLKYIRPFHFIVGVKSGKSFNDVDPQ